MTMIDILAWVAAAGAVLAAAGAWMAWARTGTQAVDADALADMPRQLAAMAQQQQAMAAQMARLERDLRDDAAAANTAARQESAESARALRSELMHALAQGQQALGARQVDQTKLINQQLDGFAQNLATLTAQLQDRFEALRGSLSEQANATREASANSLEKFGTNLHDSLRAQGDQAEQRLAAIRDQVDGRLKDLQADSGARLAAFAEKLEMLTARLQERLGALRDTLTAEAKIAREESAVTLQGFSDRIQEGVRTLSEANERRIDGIRTTVETRLKDLQTDNAAKLDAMRQTVDEKLQATLEQRLGESFKLVSERLEAVHKGLGEMQTLANGVGDLKRVLTNVKSRGTWGEVQLAMLIEQTMTPDQYARNVKPLPGSADIVEFAIRLPGREASGEPVWLPIDAKFPKEEYERLCDAQDRADVEAVRIAGAAFERGVELEAKRIQEKYVQPPHTTDFGIMFLPTEGLYAEVLRRPGLIDRLQALRINVAGPSTLAALLNSLQMGFRTLAIEQRSSEVWKVLGAVKTEFGKFGDVLASVKRTLDTASNKISLTETRARVMQRHLKQVEALPDAQATALLGPNAVDDDVET